MKPDIFPAHGHPAALPALLLALVLAFPAQAQAREPAVQTPGASLCPPHPEAPPAPSENALKLSSERSEYSGDGRLLLEGDVRISHGRRRLSAAHATWLQAEDRVDLEGDIRYHDPQLWLESERGSLHPNARRAHFEDLRYRLAGRGRGRAELLERFEAITRLRNLDYSSCPGQSPAWQLKLRELELEHAAGQGTARGAVFKLFGVPVFYLPYLNFPIGNRRQSGFLLPVLGLGSRSGLDVRMPYYWNIAPQRDATLSLRILSRRGAMPGLEYRQLHHNGRALFYGELLPADLADRKRLRGLLRLELEQSLPGGWEAELDWRSVSDHRYLEDLGDTLSQTSEQRLEQRLELHRQRGGLRLTARLLNFQELASSNAAAANRLLPELEVAYAAQGADLDFGLRGTLSRFQGGAEANGLRLDLLPQLGYRLRYGGSYLHPRLTLRYTHYELERDGAAGKRNAKRLLPELRVDGGLRLAAGGHRGAAGWERFLYLFEPRLLYRFAPYREQSRLPLFDSTRVDFSRAFLEANVDRFSGADRVGDDNRLGLLLGARVLDPETGRQWAELTLGRYFHLRRQRLRLPGEPPDTERASPLLAALQWNPAPDWRWHGELHWRLKQGILTHAVSALYYRVGRARIFNLGYRYRRDALHLHQVDASFHWELGPRWALTGRWQRSLHSSSPHDLELFLGVERRHCCWTLRLLGRRFAPGGVEGYENGLFLEVALHGLGHLGYDIVGLFRTGLPGYPGGD